MKCPNCKTRDVEFKPDPDDDNREKGFCPCNPAGPVVSRPIQKAKSAAVKADTTKADKADSVK